METYLEKAFKNASDANNQIKTNPKVGAIIVKNERVLAEGIHEMYGGPHAEINALNQVSESLEGAEMFVTLEPCSHHGKTPPCADAIIASGIKKVTIGSLDPNPVVSGNGVKKLEEAGIEVVVENDLDAQMALNNDYFKKIETNVPYVIVKTGMSLDGKIALSNHQSKWITNAASRKKVQTLRSQVNAILTGVGTILNDDPKLTVHNDASLSPIRIILDTKLKTPLDSYVIKTASEIPTWIFTSMKEDQRYIEKGVKWFQVPLKDGRVDLKAVFLELSNHPIKNVLVEAGPTLTTSLLQEEWIDEWHLFIASKWLGADALNVINPLGLTDLKQAIQFKPKSVQLIEDDIYTIMVKERTS